MLKDLFRPKQKYVTIRQREDDNGITFPEQLEKKELPDGLWIKCNQCNQMIYHKDLEKNLKVCPKCQYHFRIGAWERIEYLVDPGTFHELFANISSCDPLGFPEYQDKLNKFKKATGLNEGVVTGTAQLEGIPLAIGVMDFGFVGGSMGSALGERLVRLFEYAYNEDLPVITFAASGGARMQEGILSLMQMAATCQAVNRLAEKAILFISVLTDPTTGGVFASFASQGDINIAEPGALIGFAGARVIQQTTRQTLPPGFQRSEFLLEHGIIDLIVNRKELRSTLARLLRFHQRRKREIS
ncbi:MAG: acetyl-CoA carboxylase carboxyltransferase subunit beta [Firmicutes bacterium]|nr:acetyl-CoA carboxylase carboxyltransferase subunit beta [Bacillota bacterium]